MKYSEWLWLREVHDVVDKAEIKTRQYEYYYNHQKQMRKLMNRCNFSY